MLAIKPNTHMVTLSSHITRRPSQSLQKAAVPKIDLVLFDRREHALAYKRLVSVPNAKQFILKTTKNNPACVFLINVPADSPLLFSVLFLVAPRIPHVCVSHFLSSFLPHSLLFGSAAALEDAWHHLYLGRSHKGDIGAAKGS